MKLSKYVPVLLLLLSLQFTIASEFSGSEYSDPRLSNKQIQLLDTAFITAKADGHSYPQLLQGIILQESNAGNFPQYKIGGKHLPPNKRYYGVAQIKLVAAKAVLQRYPELYSQFNIKSRTDAEIINHLMNDDSFNIAIASKYLLVLKNEGYHTTKSLALAYNQGPAGARRSNPNTHYYPNSVIKKIRNLYS